MKFCSLFMGCAIVVAGVVGALTKEKLRHYLAFECAIREIAAVSDRHCLATDNPRTSVATIPLSPPPGQIYAFLLSLSLSRARSPPLLSPLHHSQLSRALYAACTYTSPPIAFSLALCLMNAHSNILSQRAWKDAFTREKWPFAPTTRSPSFPNYSPLPHSSRDSRFSSYYHLASAFFL